LFIFEENWQCHTKNKIVNILIIDSSLDYHEN